MVRKQNRASKPFPYFLFPFPGIKEEPPREQVFQSVKLREMTTSMRSLQHTVNALHIYALLLRLKIRKGFAMTLAKGWERIVHYLIY